MITVELNVFQIRLSAANKKKFKRKQLRKRIFVPEYSIVTFFLDSEENRFLLLLKHQCKSCIIVHLRTQKFQLWYAD